MRLPLSQNCPVLILKVALYSRTISVMLSFVSTWRVLVHSHPSPFVAMTFRSLCPPLHRHGKGELMNRHFRLTVILLGLFALHCVALGRVSADDYWPHCVDPFYEYLSLIRGPDGFIWTYLKDVLVRIDPRDARIHVVGKIDPVGSPTFVGNDLYFSGSEQLRRIRNVAPNPLPTKAAN